jgi:hypothetical protein
MTNWRVNGSIGASLPVQTRRSKLPIVANLCENYGDSFLDSTSAREDLQHIRVRICGTLKIIEVFVGG